MARADPIVSRTANSSTPAKASVAARPCMVRGVCRVTATPCSGVVLFVAWRYRFSQPSRVLFTPGVADSM